MDEEIINDLDKSSSREMIGVETELRRKRGKAMESKYKAV